MLKSPRTGSHRAANDAPDRLIALIHRYQQTAARAVRALQMTCSIRDPLEAWHTTRIPKCGDLNANAVTGRYEFHGVGCRFEFNGEVVDLDFGPLGRYDGFDAWRLGQFASDNEFLDGTFRNLPALERAFKELAQTATIICPGWQPSPHLYYFISDVPK